MKLTPLRLVAQLIAANGVPPRHPALVPFLKKVREGAYKVTDEDVEALKIAGLTEDEIFHAITHEAMLAGLHRLNAGLGTLK